MYLTETKGMHVASDSSGTLEIRWHRHCNKAVLYFVKHRETRIVAAIFEGAPTEVTAQHRRNAVSLGIHIEGVYTNFQSQRISVYVRHLNVKLVKGVHTLLPV